MRTSTLAIVVLLATLSGCRIFRAAEWERRDNCARIILVYRSEPALEYRTIGIVEAVNDNDVAWQACALGANAVIFGGLDPTQDNSRRGKNKIRARAVAIID